MAKKWYSYFVVTDEPAPAEPAGSRSKPVPPTSAEELLAAATPMPAPSVEDVSPAVTLDEVYQAAKIEVPAHGYTVFKVAEMLYSEHLEALTPEIKKKSVLVALDAARVSVDDIVRDAVRRDKALDTYERVLEQYHAQVQSRVAAENQELEAEIARRVAELRQRIDANNQAVIESEKELAAWRRQKQQDEQRIAEAVSYFVTENPISVSGTSDTSRGETDVR